MQNNKNFQEVLVAFINGLGLELTARLDYFKADGDDLEGFAQGAFAVFGHQPRQAVDVFGGCLG